MVSEHTQVLRFGVNAMNAMHQINYCLHTQHRSSCAITAYTVDIAQSQVTCVSDIFPVSWLLRCKETIRVVAFVLAGIFFVYVNNLYSCSVCLWYLILRLFCWRSRRGGLTLRNWGCSASSFRYWRLGEFKVFRGWFPCSR